MSLIKDKSSIDLFLAFSKVLKLHRQKEQDENTTIESEKFTVADKILELSKKFAKKKNIQIYSTF